MRASRTSDEVYDTVGEESKTAQSLKRSLEEHLTLVDSTFRSLKTARDLLQEAIKETEKAIHLAPLAYRWVNVFVGRAYGGGGLWGGFW